MFDKSQLSIPGFERPEYRLGWETQFRMQPVVPFRPDLVVGALTSRPNPNRSGILQLEVRPEIPTVAVANP